MKWFLYLICIPAFAQHTSDEFLDAPKANIIEEVIPHYQNCCYCFYDPKDQSTQEECKVKMAEFDNTSTCEQSESHNFKEYLDSNKTSSRYTCESARIYGTYHANEKRFERPFLLSLKIANLVKAKSVCYDGNSCLIFNDEAQVKKCASTTGPQAPDCRFEISGNQLSGRVQRSSLLELPSKKSRSHIYIQNNKVTLVYGVCSSPNTECPYEVEPQKDNTKTCSFNKKVYEQTCCKGPSSGSPNTGRWSEIGKSCN